MSKMFNFNKQKSFFVAKKELLVDGCCVAPVCCGEPNVPINYNLFSKGNKLFNKQQTLFGTDGCCVAHNDPCCVACTCNDTNYSLLLNYGGGPDRPFASNITLSLTLDLVRPLRLNIILSNTDDQCNSTIDDVSVTSSDPVNIITNVLITPPVEVSPNDTQAFITGIINNTIPIGSYSIDFEYSICGQLQLNGIEINIIP